MSEVTAKQCVSFMFTRFRAVKPLRNNIIAQYIYRSQSLVKKKQNVRDERNFNPHRLGWLGWIMMCSARPATASNTSPYIHEQDAATMPQGDVENEQPLLKTNRQLCEQ